MLRKRKNRGVTFLELMVVIVILAAVIVMSAPKMKGFEVANELAAGAREIVSLCRFARAQAILTETKTEVKFDIENDQFWLDLNPDVNNNKTKDRWREKNELQNYLEEVKSLPRYVKFNEIDSDAPDFKLRNDLVRIIYYPNGSATSAYIVLENTNKKMLTIEIPRATGYPEVYSGLPTDVSDRIKEIKNEANNQTEEE